MAIVLQNASEFTVDLANQLLKDELSETVSSVSVKPLGEGVGLMSSIGRAKLQMSGGSQKSVIVKVIAQTENVEISKNLNFYANEINYYRHLASLNPIASPRCLFADIDAQTQDFLLILEDLGDDAAGDQLQDCSDELLELAFRQAGQMHGTFWGKTENYPWLKYQNNPELTKFKQQVIYQPGIEPTLNNFGDCFSGNLPDVVTEIGEQFAVLFDRAMSGPQTIVHGDFRVDNMLLPVVNGKVSIVGVDWQNTSGGNGPHDIAYFCSQSCSKDLELDVEMQHLRAYHDTLLEYGVKGYSFDHCLEDYRLNLMITMITPIAICGTLDSGNERGKELGRVVLSRSLAALERMDCGALLS